MTISDFRAFYESVHHNPPFPWQERLLERVINRGWPRTISLPTSSGKTSAIDIAVFHLALEAGRSASERSASLRVFFVIDRRVVVDEAAEHALELARALINPKDAIVKEVADALREFGAKHALDVAVLRGGMYRDNTWADEPNQPLVCVSTVDQIGSRLLFRGYQVSDRARSVHAGLVSNDALMIVDEAHLSAPFLDTLTYIESEQRKTAKELEVIRGLEVLKMSATLESNDNEFRLEEADYENPVLSKRLMASKPAEMRSPAKEFEGELVRAAKELASLPGVFVTAVVVNTVAVARSVFEQLNKSRDSEQILLTGRSRPHDAKKLWEKYKPRIAAKPDRVSNERLFVVATQTVEVGANLDFDALVTESAPLDALRQRFGRLNRLGNHSEPVRAILVQRPKPDAVYGERTVKAWELLLGLGNVNFGVVAMDEALRGVDTAPFMTQRSRGPLLFSKYLEMWAQTNPTPDPDPDVAPFLHGRDALEEADVQVVWREDLLEDGSAQSWQDALEAAPPVSSEALALPLGALRRWLRSETKLNVADVEGAGYEEEDAGKTNRKKAKPVLIWRGQADGEPPTEIRPGDVVVVPATYGGCDEFGWCPDSRESVEDIGDEANNVMAEKGLRTCRLRVSVYANGLEPEKERIFLDLIQRFEEARKEGERQAEEDIRREIDKMLPNFPGKWRIDSEMHVLSWPKSPPKAEQIETSLKPEDQDDSAGLERAITLATHTHGVVEHVQKYAEHCGLSNELVEDLVLAAKLHDLGKCDDRFQDWLWQSSKAPAKAMRRGEPLAKSDGELTWPERRRAQIQSGYPKGARHESASVLLACASQSLAHANDRDLVLHLIGTHHGYGRPLLPFWKEEEEIKVCAEFEGETLEASTGRKLARFDSGVIEQFSRLNVKYGYWGLAYLEAIFRRADGMQSREEQEPEQ